MNYSKDGITVATTIDTSHPKQDGTFPVKIRVTYARQRRYYPTGKDLTLDQWNTLSTAKGQKMGAVRKDIENSYNIVRSTVEELASAGEFTLDALNNRLKRATGDTVNTAFRAKIEALRQAGRIGNMIVYDNVLKGIERFAGNAVYFDSVTVNWLKRYEEFLRDEDKTQTTIAIHLRTLRAILNDARQVGMIKEAQYPFGRGR